MTQGAKRGLFSNEAGMGSTPHAHATGTGKIPARTGMRRYGRRIYRHICRTDLKCPGRNFYPVYKDGILANGYTGAALETVDKTNLAQTAFGAVFGEQLGAQFVAVTLFFFAFSTILGWNLFGRSMLPICSAKIHEDLYCDRTRIHLPRNTCFQRPRVGVVRYVQ